MSKHATLPAPDPCWLTMTKMFELRSLPLGSPRWTELTHAYGVASDIPNLLQQLAVVPLPGNGDEVWESLWSALAHQGDVYPASFAALPHVVLALATSPSTADFNYFLFPSVIESSRQEQDVEIPEDLRDDYFAALDALPALVAQAADREWDEELLRCALSAIAAAKGSGKLAEVVLELNPEVCDEFMEWQESR